jgi:hypothetical protein
MSAKKFATDKKGNEYYVLPGPYSGNVTMPRQAIAAVLVGGGKGGTATKAGDSGDYYLYNYLAAGTYTANLGDSNETSTLTNTANLIGVFIGRNGGGGGRNFDTYTGYSGGSNGKPLSTGGAASNNPAAGGGGDAVQPWGGLDWRGTPGNILGNESGGTGGGGGGTGAWSGAGGGGGAFGSSGDSSASAAGWGGGGCGENDNGGGGGGFDPRILYVYANPPSGTDLTLTSNWPVTSAAMNAKFTDDTGLVGTGGAFVTVGSQQLYHNSISVIPPGNSAGSGTIGNPGALFFVLPPAYTPFTIPPSIATPTKFATDTKGNEYYVLPGPGVGNLTLPRAAIALVLVEGGKIGTGTQNGDSGDFYLCNNLPAGTYTANVGGISASTTLTNASNSVTEEFIGHNGSGGYQLKNGSGNGKTAVGGLYSTNFGGGGDAVQPWGGPAFKGNDAQTDRGGGGGGGGGAGGRVSAPITESLYMGAGGGGGLYGGSASSGSTTPTIGRGYGGGGCWGGDYIIAGGGGGFDPRILYVYANAPSGTDLTSTSNWASTNEDMNAKFTADTGLVGTGGAFVTLGAQTSNNNVVVIPTNTDNPNGQVGAIFYVLPPPVPTVPTVPDAPTNVTAIATSSTSVRVTWNIPQNDGGSAIGGYKVRKSDNTLMASVTGATSNSAIVTGLTPNTSYTFVVYAGNQIGASAPSAEVVVIPTEEVLNPNTESAPPPFRQPINLTVTSHSLATTVNLEISWNYFPYTQSVVRIRMGDIITKGVKGNSYTLKNVQPNTLYAVDVYVNDDSDSVAGISGVPTGESQV